MSKKKIEKAKVFNFIFKILLKNRISVLKDTIPNFLFRMKSIADEKKFWIILRKNVTEFNPNNDHFIKMFEKQLYFKYRNTINSEICSIKNKILNDY